MTAALAHGPARQAAGEACCWTARVYGWGMDQVSQGVRCRGAQEASVAWEKRQALLRRKRSRAQSRGWGPFGGGGGGETEAAAGARAYGAPRGERSVDVQRATAVAAATAARRCC